MTVVNELNTLALIEETTTDQSEELDIPIDLSDIISICREYNKLGWQIQQQVENILEIGVEEAIKSGYVRKESLPFIKSFLKAIAQNVYFGDAVSQADECVKLIQQYEMINKIKYEERYN